MPEYVWIYNNRHGFEYLLYFIKIILLYYTIIKIAWGYSPS